MTKPTLEIGDYENYWCCGSCHHVIYVFSEIPTHCAICKEEIDWNVFDDEPLDEIKNVSDLRKKSEDDYEW